jgi:hypothetical protein
MYKKGKRNKKRRKKNYFAQILSCKTLYNPECDSAITTIRQCNDNNAITRWRLCDNVMPTQKRDNAMATVRYRDGDNAIVLSHYRIIAIALSLCRHRVIALSSSHYRIVNHRTIALSHYRTVVITLSHCRHRTIALSSSH